MKLTLSVVLLSFMCLLNLNQASAEANNSNSNTNSNTNSQTTTKDDSNVSTTPTAPNTTPTDPKKPKLDFTGCNNKASCIDELISEENQLDNLVELIRIFDDLHTFALENNCLSQRCISPRTFTLIVESAENKFPPSFTYDVDFGTDIIDSGFLPDIEEITTFSGVLGVADKKSLIGCKQTSLQRLRLQGRGGSIQVKRLVVYITYVDYGNKNTPLVIFESDNTGKGWTLSADSPITISRSEILQGQAWRDAVADACSK